MDILDVKEEGWQGKSDEELLNLAHRENRWIFTHDSDFGTLAIHKSQKFSGILFLRLKKLSSDHIITACTQLLKHSGKFFQGDLVIVKENRIRIRRMNNE